MDALISLWKRSWESAGFDPIVLCEDDARSHPGYEYFAERISRFPSINPSAYERACYMRHAAMANIGGGCLLDADVMPHPRKQVVIFQNSPGNRHGWVEEKFLILEPERVPCAVVGTQEGYEEWCDILCEYDPPAPEKHVSDMIIAQAAKMPCTNLCIEYLHEGWREAAMLHFSTGSFYKQNWCPSTKADVIPQVLAKL